MNPETQLGGGVQHICTQAGTSVTLLKTRGDKAFIVKAPKLWKELPEKISSAEPVTSLKSTLQNRAWPDFAP